MARIHQRSFGGGEIAPEMLGRIDLNHYLTGLETCSNFYPLPHGPVVNRPGFQFIKEVKDGGTTCPQLIPFIFNNEQAYALEFGNLYMRVHTEGATVLNASKTISGATRANPCVITATSHGYTNGTEVYIASVVGMTELNGRYFKVKSVSTHTFELTDLQDNNINSSAYTTYGSAGTASSVFELTTTYATADLFDLSYAQSADVLTIVHPTYPPREVTRTGAANWAIADITFAPSIAAPGSVAVAATTGSGSVTYKYVVTALESDILEESVASSEVSVTNDLATSPNKNTVSWGAVTGAVRYNVYKDNNGVHGYIGQTPDTSFVDDNIEADVLTSPPENQTPFDGTDKYPSTVSYHDQRRVFGATNNNPQTTWMSRAGSGANLSKSIPSQDNDAIQFSLDSRQFNRIKHFIPLDDLLLFTTAAEWKLFTQNSDALTPTTIATRPQSYVGCGDRTPILSGDAVLFVANQGSHVYDLNFDFNSGVAGKYTPRDISIVAPHLFDGFTISDWDYSSVPYSIAWMVRSDGKLLGLTYLSGQKPDILGWHQHTTDGNFESTCVIPENNGEKMLYVVVQRRINGVNRRFVERMHSRIFEDVRDAFHVDSGLSYDDPKTITAATQANPVVITSASHGFTNGDVVQITDVAGLGTETGMTELNGNRYTVASASTNTFALQDTAATPANVDGSAYTAYVSGGKVRKEITTVTGLHHLIGESVTILADGSVMPSQTVTATGEITLSQGAARIHIGLAFTSDMRTLPIAVAQAEASGQGRFKSATKVYLRVNKTRGIFAGPDVSHLREYAQRTSEVYGAPTNMVSDEIEIRLDSAWSRGGQVSIRQSDPTPITILSMTWEGETGA